MGLVVGWHRENVCHVFGEGAPCPTLLLLFLTWYEEPVPLCGREVAPSAVPGLHRWGASDVKVGRKLGELDRLRVWEESVWIRKVDTESVRGWRSRCGSPRHEE